MKKHFFLFSGFYAVPINFFRKIQILFRYGYKNLVMVGDGATDMEACPPADAFIGFGGNQVCQIHYQREVNF